MLAKFNFCYMFGARNGKEFSMSTSRTSPSRGAHSPEVTGFYERDTGSIQYVVSDPATKKAAIIDAVWNFDPRSARTGTGSADAILDHVRERGLSVDWVLDTHPHADHFMAAAYLKQKLNCRQAIGEKVREIAGLWRQFYNEPDAFDVDTMFDRLFADGETFELGQAADTGDAVAGPYARLDHLCGWRRRGLGARHVDAAGFGFLARRFPRRRCGHALSLHSSYPRAAGADAAVRRP